MGGYKRVKNEKNIEIMEADNSGPVVTFWKFHYKSMILSQINDEKTFKKWYSSPNQAITQETKAIITRYKLLLADSKYKYLF